MIFHNSNHINYTEIVGSSWISKNRTIVENHFAQVPHFFEQLEIDLGVLLQHVEKNRIIGCYQTSLRHRNLSQLVDTIYEIHGVSLLARMATQLQLHVLRGEGTNHNFDVQAVIAGSQINADVKTCIDRFPLNCVGGGWRPTADRHEIKADKLEPDIDRPDIERPISNTPYNKNIRDKLLDTLNEQLPVKGINLVLLGHVQGDRQELEYALEGAPVLNIYRSSTTKKSWCEWSRLSTGAFTGSQESEVFRPLSGVLWFRLMRYKEKLLRGYKLYVQDPKVANFPIPNLVIQTFRETLEVQAVTHGDEAFDQSVEIVIRKF